MLGGSKVTTNLTVTAGGDITQSAALTVGDSATFTTATTSDVVLTDTGNAFNTVAVTQANNVSLEDTDAIVLGASVITGTLDVTAGGNITSSGALDVSKAASFTAGSATGQSIILDNTGNTFAGTVTFAQSSKTLDTITFVNDVSGSTSYTFPAKVGNLSLTQSNTAGAVVLGGSTVSGNLTVTASVTPALAGNRKMQLLLDGVVASGPSRTTTFQLLNVDRGTHELQAQVVDPAGRALFTSPASVFHMLRYSAIRPAKPAARGNAGATVRR